MPSTSHCSPEAGRVGSSHAIESGTQGSFYTRRVLATIYALCRDGKQLQRAIRAHRLRILSVVQRLLCMCSLRPPVSTKASRYIDTDFTDAPVFAAASPSRFESARCAVDRLRNSFVSTDVMLEVH